MSTGEGARRYPPLIAAGVVLALALGLLPSALSVPQPNPATTLEYAPIPSGRRAPSSQSGNLHSLALASSSTLTGVADEPQRSAAVARGAAKNPATKRCVGSPPRQTSDPLAPPCVAYFDGDNGGATYAGVTREEIRILIYEDCCWYNVSSRGADEQARERYYDLAKPPDGDEPVDVRGLRLFQRYFNDRYQTYGRFAHFFVYYGAPRASDGNVSVEQRRADAAGNHATVRPFAIITNTPNGNEDVYLDDMNRRGVMTFGSTVGRDASFYQRHPRLIWGYYPSVQVQARQFAEYVCRRVVGRATSTGGTRRLGLLRTHNAGFPGMQRFAALVRDRVEACGGTFAAERTFNVVRRAYTADEASVRAAENMAAFREAGVTTVVWAQGYETNHSKAGARIGYYPEWIVAGDGSHDGYLPQTHQDQSAWQHARVVSNVTLEPPIQESRCAQALREADPQVHAQDVSHLCTFRRFSIELGQLFAGIQVAGPRLTPESIDRGFRAIPPVRSTDPGIPACFYEPGDYTCVKDAVAMWWDPSADNPGGVGAAGTRGAWRVPLQGRRYLSADWPREDADAHRHPADPVNYFPGAFFLA